MSTIHLDFHMIGAIDEAIFYDVNNFKTFAYIQFLFLLYLYYYDSNIIGVKIKIRIRMGGLLLPVYYSNLQRADVNQRSFCRLEKELNFIVIYKHLLWEEFFRTIPIQNSILNSIVHKYIIKKIRVILLFKISIFI
ncbi:unnamed protein product [Rhizophagus irregularis]|nr:unnamed protein product [Rhizophagus irregularis]